MDGQGMWHAWKRRDMHTRYWCGNLKENEQFEDPGINVKSILKIVLKKPWEIVDWIDLAQDRE
jgi:hypothetical protein